MYNNVNKWRTAAGLIFASFRRMAELAKFGGYDVVAVQREAALIGPPITEWFLHRVRHRPLLLDLDDATWVEYESPTYGRLAHLLKSSTKAHWLIRHASIVTCGSTAVAQYVEQLNKKALIVPTVVDLRSFAPSVPVSAGGLPTIGWIGSHSTWQYMVPILPILKRVAAEQPFRLVIVGHGGEPIELPGIELDIRPWLLENEPADFAAIDIGLYPITDSSWATGKSGLKAVEYMSAGIPFVASPVGEVAHMGKPGCTHFIASSEKEWANALSRLLVDPQLRESMGQAGRAFAEAHYGIDRAADALAGAIYRAAGTGFTES